MFSKCVDETVLVFVGSAHEAELAVGECEAKLSVQRQTITSLQSTVASIDRIKAEAAAAQHERDIMAEQLKAALGQTRKMEIACQEWIAEVQREARLSMALSPSLSLSATANPAAAQSGVKSYAHASHIYSTLSRWIIQNAEHMFSPQVRFHRGEQSSCGVSLEPQLRCRLNSRHCDHRRGTSCHLFNNTGQS